MSEEKGQPNQPEQPVKARRGCMFYGCMLGLVMLLLAAAGGLLGLHYAKKMLTNFTDAAPVPLPVVKMSEAEITQLHKRVDDFSEAVRSSRPAPPLALTSDELNELIQTNPDLEEWKGKLYLTFEGNQIRGKISLPMDQVLPLFRGRYLNGEGLFDISLKRGFLRLTARQLWVKGNPLPDKYMQEIRNQNLAKRFNSDPRVSIALDKLQSIDVKDGKLVITPQSVP